jgi:hypothetical protein
MKVVDGVWRVIAAVLGLAAAYLALWYAVEWRLMVWSAVRVLAAMGWPQVLGPIMILMAILLFSGLSVNCFRLAWKGLWRT